MADAFNSTLGGLKVLDLTEGRGLYTGKMLADFGADVIKIENPEGSKARRIGPFKDDEPDLENSLYFINFNTNKRGITLNIDSPDGKDIFKKLVRRSDVLVEDLGPDKMQSLEIDYNILKRLNRCLIMASVTGFGQAGPYSQYKAPDLVSFAMGGLMYVSGQPDAAPVVAPCEQAYYSASIMAVFGVLAALYLRISTKEGQLVDVSAQETMAAFNQRMVNYSVASELGKRLGSQYNEAAPARIYPCKDGYVHLMVLRAAHWRTFLELLGNPETLMGDGMYDPGFRVENADLIDNFVEEFTMAHTKAEIVSMCQAKKIPCTPVNTTADFSNDPHEIARGFITEVEHPVIGRHSYLGPPYRFSKTPCRIDRPAPKLGQHNREIYHNELGYTEKKLASFKKNGII